MIDSPVEFAADSNRAHVETINSTVICAEPVPYPFGLISSLHGS